MKIISVSTALIAATLIGCSVCKEEMTSGVVSRMEMDNMDDMDSDDSIDPSQTTIPESEITPIPHIMKHQHGVPIMETHLEPAEHLFWDNYNTTTYFNVDSNHRGALFTHIGLLMFSFIILYPIYLVLQNAGSNWYLPVLMLHCGLVTIGLLCYSVFMGSIDKFDLYPGNSYTPMSWILLFTNGAHLIFAFISSGYKYISNDNSNYFGISDEETCASPTISMTEFSRDSNERASEEPFESPIHEDFSTKTSNNAMFTPYKSPLRVVYNIKWISYAIDHFGKTSVYCFKILNWIQFFYFLIYFPTGIAVFLVLGKGVSVFNLLAHFIKGGVFFTYGIITLARYCGAWTNKGWAWNHKFIFNQEVSQKLWHRIQSSGLCTMEMIESSSILFYGCTNIFLEHLSNPGNAYSTKDLQHASIAFIFIGCGLCGVITEIKLSSWRLEKSVDNFELHCSSQSSQKISKASPGFSPNPFPIITIYWTGVLMSKHQQASDLSTDIHQQWGNMFAMGCAFRLITYILMLILPSNKNLTRPSRPLTELLVSFALVCGGMIFMESTDPVIYAFEYHGYTAMLTLNVSLGVGALLMGWVMTIFAFKDWLIKRR